MVDEDMAWLAKLRPVPVGFPACRRCRYRDLGRGEVCLVCVGAAGPSFDRGATACPVCGQPLPAGTPCGNDWCARGDRWWSVVWSIAPHVGSLRHALLRYKYRAETEWSAVFGRLLVGFLDDHMPWFDEYDALVPVPAFLGPGARRRWDPIGRVVAEAAGLAGRRWPVEAGAIVKTAETAPMAGLSLGGRRACAEGALRRALLVPDPARVRGARLLVVDDVFTEGSTLREVARAMRRAGAVEVAGLALARQPWSGLGDGRGPALDPRHGSGHPVRSKGGEAREVL
ncbi:MAG TPA: phosphoribosyltransferase family protein [Acidimicrobiales bacterium]